MQDQREHHSPSSEEAEKNFFFRNMLAGLGRFSGRFGLMVVGVAALGALIYLVISADGFVRNNELKKEKAKLEAEIETLEDENRLLSQRLERLQTDPGYVEDEARKKLRLIRPGEIIYRLSDEPDVSEPQPPKEPPLTP